MGEMLRVLPGLGLCTIAHGGMRPLMQGNTGAGDWFHGHYSRAAAPDLDDAEKAALIAELKQTIAADPFPLSPCIRTLRAIVDKLEPPEPRPAIYPRIEVRFTTSPSTPPRRGSSANFVALC